MDDGGLPRTRAEPALRARVVAPESLTSDEIAAWRALLPTNLADLAAGSPFLSPAFALAASRALAGGGVRVCVLRDAADAPVGFLPFQFADRLAQTLGLAQRVGGELNDYFGLVARPGLRVGPTRLLRLARLQALLFSHLAPSQGAHGLVGERPETGLRTILPSPEPPSPGRSSGDDGCGSGAYWEALRPRAKHFVVETDRRERRLTAAHGTLRFALHSSDVARDLTRLIAVKREQYARTAVDDPLASVGARRLLAELAALDDPDCRGVLSTLHAGDTWVALHLGLMRGGTWHYWFPVYNPELQAFSPGRLIVKAMLAAAPAAGIGCIDYGAGDAQHKRAVANQEYAVTSGLWRRDTPGGLLAQARLSIGWRLARRAASRAATAAASVASAA